MGAVEGNIQEALSLMVRPHRSQALPSRHSLRVSACWQQSFKRLIGGALLPQQPPLLSACRVQRVGLYHLVNPRWWVPKSLPAALCIPQSVGQMLQRLQCYLDDHSMWLLQVSVNPDCAPEACHWGYLCSVSKTFDATAVVIGVIPPLHLHSVIAGSSSSPVDVRIVFRKPW